jgi:hypothetical protein
MGLVMTAEWTFHHSSTILGQYSFYHSHTSLMHYRNYYSINWQWRERLPEEMNQLNLIAEFLNTKPALIDTNLPESMILIQGIEKEKELEDAKIEVKILMDKRQKLIEAAKT